MNWSIEPLLLHRVLVPGPEVLFQRGFGETIELAIHAYLLRSAAAVVLVDTGLAADHAALDADVRRRKGPQSGFGDVGERLPQRLAQRGIVSDAVVLTSFGPYACGALHEIEARCLYLSARGQADLRSPEEPALVHAVAPHIRTLLLSGDAVTGEREILPGLVFEEVGIHHPASAALRVRTAEGVVAIADPVFHRRNLQEGVALGAAEHAAAWHAMVRRLARCCDAFVPIHDPDPRPLALRDLHACLR